LRGAPDQIGFLAVGKEFHVQSAGTPIERRVAFNLQGQGNRAIADVMQIPEGR